MLSLKFTRGIKSLTFSVGQGIVIRFECFEESLFVDERQQSDSLPCEFFSVQVDFKVFGIKVDNRWFLREKIHEWFSDRLAGRQKCISNLPDRSWAVPRVPERDESWQLEKRPSIVPEDGTRKIQRQLRQLDGRSKRGSMIVTLTGTVPLSNSVESPPILTKSLANGA